MTHPLFAFFIQISTDTSLISTFKPLKKVVLNFQHFRTKNMWHCTLILFGIISTAESNQHDEELSSDVSFIRSTTKNKITANLAKDLQGKNGRLSHRIFSSRFFCIVRGTLPKKYSFRSTIILFRLSVLTGSTFNLPIS
jgi:hypothetical protein